VAITAPVPRRPHRFWRWDHRWMTFSRHPGPPPVPRPFPVRDRRAEHPFETTRSPRLSSRNPRRPRPPFTRPALSFWSALPCLFETRCSPADFCNCFTTYGQKPELLILAGTEGHDPPSFSFSCHAAFLAEAVTRGEPRYVRPIKPRCRFLPLSRVCPTAIPDRRATPVRLTPPGVQ
jgi:hypothetical protein